MSTQHIVDRPARRRLTPSFGMRAKFLREAEALNLPAGPRSVVRPAVTESDLSALPAPAQQFMRFMRVVGRPRDWSFCARWDGRFRTSPKQTWMPCEAWQYDTSLGIARVFHMRLRMGGVLPTYVRDIYAHHGGHMVGKVFDTFSIVDDACEKVTVGELVTYLNDALMFAPSMLLDEHTSWQAVDSRTFDVALIDRLTTVMGRVTVDDDGALVDFSTHDRFGRDPAKPHDGLVRTRWSTPVTGWSLVGDRMRPLDGRAIWHFPSSDFCYADFDTASMEIVMNVGPGVGP